jgi:ketosteroid isomerase-like protein
VGREEYREALRGFLEDFADLRYETERVIVEDSMAAVAYRMSFVWRSAGGRHVAVRGVFVFEVEDTGLIARRTDYWDSGQVAAQLES